MHKVQEYQKILNSKQSLTTMFASTSITATPVNWLGGSDDKDDDEAGRGGYN
jgi:hypothetical protein